MTAVRVPTVSVYSNAGKDVFYETQAGKVIYFAYEEWRWVSEKPYVSKNQEDGPC